MSSKRFSSIMAVFLLITAVVCSSGCGGGGSNSGPIAENSVNLMDALGKGAKVEIDISWKDEIHTIAFENIGRNFFERTSGKEENFNSMLMRGEDDTLLAIIMSSQYQDEWFTIRFDGMEDIYKEEMSYLLGRIWFHEYGFLRIRVNGVDVTQELVEDEHKVAEPEETATLKDAENENASIVLDFELNDLSYHYVFRNTGEEFEMIDGVEEDFSLATMSVSPGEWLNALFDTEDDSLWMSLRFDFASNSYEIMTSEGENGNLTDIVVNGVDITDSLTRTYN